MNEDSTVELIVFSVYGRIFLNHNVERLADASTSINQQAPVNVASGWSWPPRV